MWSPLSFLQEILRGGGNIDLGIPSNATVAGSRRHKRRYHRVPMLNRVEAEIEKYKANLSQEEDVSLWKNEKERTLLLATGIRQFGLNMQLQSTLLLLGLQCMEDFRH